MTSIFVSHSIHDKWFISPLEQNLKAIKIEPILVEVETPLPYPLPDTIKKDITRSSAVFVLWTSNVAYNPTTRDNVIWEVAEAHAMNKKVLVCAEKNVALPMMIPYITTYIEFDTHNQKDVEAAFNRMLAKADEIAKQDAASGLFWLLLGVGFLGAVMSASEKKTCPRCGKEVDKNIAFCPNCGHNFKKRAKRRR